MAARVTIQMTPEEFDQIRGYLEKYSDVVKERLELYADRPLETLEDKESRSEYQIDVRRIGRLLDETLA